MLKSFRFSFQKQGVVIKKKSVFKYWINHIVGIFFLAQIDTLS